MKIQSITLTNYRLYKGENTISFDTNNNKNVYLISGKNGFGKTTFLHSLLWCLYGRLMVEIDESIRKDISMRGGYNSFLISNLNILSKQLFDSVSSDRISKIKRNGYLLDDRIYKKDFIYSVSIEFTDIYIPSIPCKSLKVTRSFDIIQGKESVEILIDGNINELSKNIGNDIFINDFILNKDIARFFFFDSERIVALAETSTIEEKRKLSSAYNEVLGVKKYEDLKKNIENLRLRFRKKSSDIEGRTRLTTLIDKQKELQNKITEQDSKIEQLDHSLIELKQKNDALQIQLFREGNKTTLSELNRLEKVIELTRNKDLEYKQQLKAFLEYAPFAISGKLFEQTRKQLAQDYSISKTSQDIQNQNILISDITSELLMMIRKVAVNTELSVQLQDNIQDVLEKYKSQTTSETQLISISKNEYHEFISIYNNITSTYKTEFERLTDDYRKNRQTLDRASRQISNMQNQENDNLIKEIRSKKNEVEEQIIHKNNCIRSLYEEKGNLNKELVTINRRISELSKNVSLDDSDIKKDLLANELIKDLDIFLTALKQEKKYSLEIRIKDAMNMLMHKENFIGDVKIQIVDDGIDINLYSPNGNFIRKESLSKGEQQLYATSILKALVDESGIEFPVFIDSPLQKFDKSHSNKIIRNFYPTISKQVILFPLLHKELTKEELGIIKPLVNTVYLIMNRDSHSYFQQTDIDLLMKE